jgi:hypothetical protein
MSDIQKGDATPNHLFKGITFVTTVGDVEFVSELQYTETEGNQFDVPEDATEVDGENLLVLAVQESANKTAGTDHNDVFRKASFLNYVQKQGFTRAWLVQGDTLDKFGTIDKYYLPVNGGFFSWEVRTSAEA